MNEILSKGLWGFLTGALLVLTIAAVSVLSALNLAIGLIMLVLFIAGATIVLAATEAFE